MFRRLREYFDFDSRMRRTRNHRRPRLRQLAAEPLEDRTLLTVVGDLTTAGATATINGALFEQIDPSSTGTGVINSFARIQASGTEEGYNTDYRPVQFDEKTDHTFNHSLKLGDVPTVTIDGTDYRQFMLDINETLPKTLISLDELQVFVQDNGNPANGALHDAVLNSDGTITQWTKGASQPVAANLIYDLDGAEESWIKLNYALNHGSGSGDMFANIPDALFSGLSDNQYVYLYSKFGEQAGYESDAGFEEWAVLGKSMNGGTKFDISGQKFEDLNGDGDVTGDPGLNGWTITLYQETNDVAGLQIGDDSFIDSTVTANVDGVDGVYSFIDIDPVNKDGVQTFYVTESPPDGETEEWIQTYGGNESNDYYTLLLNADLSFIDFGNFELIDISGTKFEDANGDGSLAGDSTLTDTAFTIKLYEWTDTDGEGDVDAGELVEVDSTETDNTGAYSFTGLEPLAAGTKYYVQEEGEGGWTQTFGTAGYVIDPTSGNDQTGLDFANFKNIDISGYKWRETENFGIWDEAETGVEGWEILLDIDNDGTVDDTALTDADGFYQFTDLGPGTYAVKEGDGPWVNWVNSYDGSTTIVAASGVNHAGTFGVAEPLNFGNIELGAGGAHTLGYWSNQNGQATIDELGGWDTVRVQLAALCLRNQDGSLFHVENSTYDEFRTWLLGANGWNMAYMLSAQAAAMKLNILAGEADLTDPGGVEFPDGGDLIYAPGVNGADAFGFITIDGLLYEAKLILHGNDLVGDAADYVLLLDGNPDRADATLVKNALDNANNNLTFLVV